jgi:uncharacterized protein (DUF302 family)
MIEYGFKKRIPDPLPEVESLVTVQLQEAGFGVLTRIDLREKFKEKLGIEYPDYVILGACNPPFAKKALDAEPDIGLMLPCNIILYEDNGDTVISIIKPSLAMGMINNPALADTAREVEKKLATVFESL